MRHSARWNVWMLYVYSFGAEFILGETSKYNNTLSIISQIWDYSGSWNSSVWNLLVNIIADDDLAMQGARESTATVLI